MDRFQRRSGFDFSCDRRGSDTTDSDGHWSRRQGKIWQRWQGSKRCWPTSQSHSGKPVQDAVTRITLLQMALTLTRRAEKCGKVGQLASVCRSSGTPQAKAKGGEKGGEVAKVRMLSRLVGLVVRVDTCRRNAPRRRSMRWKNP